MNRLDRSLDQAIAEADLGDWRPLVQAWRASEPGRALARALQARREQGAIVYPRRPFRALELTPLAATRAVIVGQDPYHGPGQAEGLAFSVPDGVAIPPSLRNIFKELAREFGITPPRAGSLQGWARQGVLLLNTSLSVEAGRAGSHARLGWQGLTDALLRAVAAEPQPKVFLLWGSHAQQHAQAIAAAGPGHLVLTSNHPSPLSALRPPRPFIGNGHFGQANRFLRAHGRGDVDWGLGGGLGLFASRGTLAGSPEGCPSG